MRTVFKVVTADMKSLGLRRNKNILSYPIGEWINVPAKDIRRDGGDRGGIWACKTLKQAKRLRLYMREKHGTQARIFEALAGEILWQSSYRVKTDRIKLLEEVAVPKLFRVSYNV